MVTVTRPTCMRTRDLLTSLAIVAAVAGCAEPPPAALPADPPSSATASSSGEVAPLRTGAVATWRLARGQAIDADATAFTAEVSRLECNSGVTGEVFAPTVVESDDRVVVTFTVAPSARRAATCQGNAPVPADVRLEAPIGDRVLVDGACEPGGGAVTTSLCSREGVRFRGAARDRG